jgi:hypothetical protein
MDDLRESTGLEVRADLLLMISLRSKFGLIDRAFILRVSGSCVLPKVVEYDCKEMVLDLDTFVVESESTDSGYSASRIVSAFSLPWM